MDNPFARQLEIRISEYELEARKCKYDDISDMKMDVHQTLYTGCVAAIERASGRNSVYSQHARSMQAGNEHQELMAIVGVCRSLLSDIRNGFIHSIEEVVHADVFSDYLEMSAYLLEAGFKDAAAVIAGSTLEAHLRMLCEKFEVETADSGKHVKADTLNANLVKANAYSKLDQKNITAWLDLRNKAAHGKYDEYDSPQVQLLLSSIRDFIARTPA